MYVFSVLKKVLKETSLRACGAGTATADKSKSNILFQKLNACKI